tara:strand:+ start:6205 stop:6606 length:402 start_codon:yes stop_codon:yes gene_type:complete
MSKLNPNDEIKHLARVIYGREPDEKRDYDERILYRCPECGHLVKANYPPDDCPECYNDMVKAVGETAEAIRCDIDGELVWIPQSQVDDVMREVDCACQKCKPKCSIVIRFLGVKRFKVCGYCKDGVHVGSKGK